MTIIASLATGCSSVLGSNSGKLDYTPAVKSVEDARAEARDISSQLFDIASVRGETSEPGPGVTTCEADPDMERLYTMHHPWSISGVSRDVLREGMERLREQLPQEGWEIIEEGEANNANRSPVILFENRDVEYAAHVMLRGKTDDDSMLHVTVVSACFSTPEGESPKGSY
ncbi:hypothetical protein [Streptomyces harbinensis]|uniref:Lipoprotein n=1 Tax=Streptomyces harbinensis TaxID=1176198 RepID=A0A1I6UWP0_9ACTN|nr:hypothetical protein [Streptomyces harbinensis]SFT05870.1 hypothetical protein SAMN05444716_106267 [Streptomyces harbinensis]